MDNKTLNLGLTFSAPYESPYAMWRRLLSSNRTLTKSQIMNLIDSESIGLYSRHAINDIYFKVIQLNYPQQMTPIYLNFFLDHFSKYEYGDIAKACYEYGDIANTCPECALVGYHCDIFRLPWVTICPIHNCKLATDCPSCSQPWPNWNQLFTRKCHHCGKQSAKKALESPKPKISTKTYRPIERIIEFISYKKNDDIYLHSSYVTSVQRRDSVNFMDKKFPSYQHEIYPSPIVDLLQSLNVEMEKVSLTIGDSHAFCKPSSGRSYSASFECLEDAVAEIRTQTLIEIHEMIEMQTNKKHDFRIYNLWYVKPKDLTQKQPPCTYCLALSYWYYLVSKHPYSTQVPDLSRSCLQFASSMCARGVPTPMNELVINGKTTLLHQSLVLVIYKRDLQLTFKSILNDVTKGVAILRGETAIENQSHCDWSDNALSSHTDESLFFSVDDETFNLRFLKESILEASHIPIIENADTICDNFFGYLTNHYFLERDTSSVNDYGLSTSQLACLQYGYDYARVNHG